MATKSTKFNMAYIIEGQQGNDVTFSDNTNILDAVIQIEVINQITSGAPASPSNGHAYIVANGGTGAFAGHDGEYAYFHDQWYFFTPRAGWMIYDIAQDGVFYYNGSEFLQLPLGSSTFLSLPDKYYGSMTTGIVSGFELSVNGVDDTLFDVAPGAAVFVNHTVEDTPTWVLVLFGGLTNITTTHLGTSGFSAVYFESNGTITQELDVLGGPTDRRTRVRLGTLIHGSLTAIDSVTTESQPAYDGIQNFRDVFYKYGPVATECHFTANGANLKLNRGTGEATLLWCNRSSDNMDPNTKVFSTVDTEHKFAYQIRDASDGFDYITALIDTVDPNYYDDGSGTKAAMPTDFWQVQRIFFSPSAEISTIRLGQNTYVSFEEAVANLETEEFTVSGLAQATINTTSMVIKQGCTDLSDTDQNRTINSRNSTIT
jgi:hypothetical protein